MDEKKDPRKLLLNAVDAVIGKPTSESTKVGPPSVPGVASGNAKLDAVPRWRREHALFPRDFNAIRPGMPYEFSHSFLSEMQQCIQVVETFSEKLNLFARQRVAFERAVLTKDLNAADAIVGQIKAGLGCSIWLLEAAILLHERRGGLEGIRQYAAQIRGRTNSQAVPYRLYWISLRAEPATSVAAFEEEVSSVLASARRDATSHLAAEHLSLRFDWHRATNFGHFDYFLWRESQLPAVDQLQSLIRVLQLIVAVGPCHEGWKTACNALNRLVKVIHDDRLRVLHALTNQTAELRQPDHDFVTRLDLFTLGHFVECNRSCRDSLVTQPHRFELYELHCKALIAGQLPYESPFAAGSLADELHRHVFNVLEKNDIATESLAAILKCSYTLDGMTLGPPLYAFYCSHLGYEQPAPAPILAAVFGSLLAPRLSEFMRSSDDAKYFLETFLDANAESPAVQLFIDVASGIRPTHPDLPAQCRTKYHARVLEAQGNYAEALIAYKHLAVLGDGRPTYEEDAATGVFRCLMKLKNYGDCVRHTVAVYLRKKGLLFSVRLLALIEALDGFDDRPIFDLDWPIFFYLYYHENRLVKDTYRIYVAYEEFLDARGLIRPSQLAAHSTQLSKFA